MAEPLTLARGKSKDNNNSDSTGYYTKKLSFYSPWFINMGGGAINRGLVSGQIEKIYIYLGTTNLIWNIRPQKGPKGEERLESEKLQIHPHFSQGFSRDFWVKGTIKLRWKGALKIPCAFANFFGKFWL